MKDKINEIVKILNQHDLNEIEFEGEGVRIKVRRESKITNQIVNNPNTEITNIENEYFDMVEEEPGLIIESPIAGTFYERPNPDSNPFVKVGEIVKKGQPLAIIESMKVMNEICAPITGKIIKLYPTNEQSVEKGQRLFKIEE